MDKVVLVMIVLLAILDVEKEMIALKIRRMGNAWKNI
jgi:hypothetical protein